MTFTNNNALESTGTIKLTFPYWNPNSPTGTYIDMISSSSPTCTGSGSLSSTLTCSYASKVLTITSISSANISSGSTLTFTVSDFTNPYNGAPKTGFTLATYNSQGCEIESTSTLFIQVTGWATITTAAITRADSVTTV